MTIVRIVAILMRWRSIVMILVMVFVGIMVWSLVMAV